MTTTSVVVGDPHTVADEIPECERLMRGAIAFAGAVGAVRLVVLGDLHHNHSTVRVEVVAFWKRVIAWARAAGLEVVFMVGNHDMSNDRSCHILIAYPEAVVVDRPTVIDQVLYLPYVHVREDFVAMCQANPTRTVVCHQLFDGSTYENGFYCGEEGVDAALIPQDLVISGHIHKPQVLGKVWYVGAPRWRIASDANEERRIYALTLDVGGAMVGAQEHDTAPYCRRIVHMQDTPDSPAAPPAPGPLVDVRVDVTGPTDYVRARAADLEAMGCRVKTVRTDAVRVEVRESDGLPRAWDRFAGAYVPTRGTPMVRVRALAASQYGLAAGGAT